MEMELEPRVKALGYKIKAMSRESPTQKAANVLDSDLRTHWSTGTNTKEWILLELEEPCLLSHIRIYNKSVLEWEITAGLRFKPEAFVKVRPRCEAPRRDMIYPTNYTPCRYVRISCLRGNPIAVFFIQLIGVSVSGLEPELQPVVTYLLPHIISHKQDPHDMHLQLLQDMTNRLLVFLPQLETDLSSFTDAAESNIRLFAMLAGPFYPILQIVKEREVMKTLLSPPELDVSRSTQSSTLTVSSNFEVQSRRPSRSSSPFAQPASSFIAFRPDIVFLLLKKAYKDSHLGTVCRIASRALHKLIEPITSQEDSSGEMTLSSSDAVAKTEALSNVHLVDYSSLFGEEYKISDVHWDATYVNILDIASVEEGIFHVLYACASQPLVCCKLADISSDFWSVLPLVQALLPALRPPVNSPDQVDDSFSQWKHASVQHAISQIVTMSSSSVHRPLLRACAGYLSSFSSSHSKAACLLVDLCSGPFLPWISTVVLKVDLAIELLEDLLGIIQGAPQPRARAALKYIILALSGYMDDVLANYKENKHKLLFLLEMLEPFLDPAMTAMKNTIAFGDVSAVFLEKQERSCAIVLNIIRTAARRPAVLPSLESEWRRGSVAPSVLLSVLGPHMPLPPDIDLCKCSVSKVIDLEPLTGSIGTSVHPHCVSLKSSSAGGADEKIDVPELPVKFDAFEETNLLFAPPELKKLVFTNLANNFMGSGPDRSSKSSHGSTEGKCMAEETSGNNIQLANSFFVDYLNLQADYLQLLDHQDCEIRASEFQRLALDLCSHHNITSEGHDAAIDALLLAAECYVNPFFMVSSIASGTIGYRMQDKRWIQMNSHMRFAAEIFHDLHEEVIATAARGHGLMLRVQQLEAEFPSIEKAFLSQTNPSPLAFNEGIDWRANLRMDQNLVTRGDMPRFILDSYEECRGPPRLFMLDKFDVAGAGACLKRYSDPSFFKVDLASSGMMEEVRKLKKKGSRWRNSETTKSFLAPFIRSNLQPVISEQISAKVPMRHIKLKSRNLMDSDISNKRSYMEHLLEVHSPEKKVIDQVASVELHETVTNTAVNSPILKKRNGIQSPAKLPIHEVADQKIKDIAVFTPSVPDEKVMIESQVKKAVTVHDYNSNEAEKYSPAILEADQQKDIVDTHISIADGFDGHGSAEKNRTDAILDGYCSRVEVDPSCLLLVDQKNSFSNLVFSSKGGFDGYRSDDVGSELENYMDALNTMESEIETDSESRQKSDPGILNMEAHRIDEFNKRQRELPAQFSEPDDLGDLTEKGLNNMLISLPSMSENSGTLSDTQLPQEDLINFYVPVIPEICLSEHVRTVDELPTISRLEESIPSAHLLTNDTCNANGSEAMSAQVGTVRAYSSSCFPESTSSGDRVCPPATGEAQSVTIHPTETFSGYVEGDHQAGQQLNGNMEELSTYAGNSNMSPDELLLLSDTGCSLLGEEDAREEIHADEVPSVVHPPNETFLGVENTDETCEQLTAKEEVLKFPDNYDSNELLLSPETEGSFSNSIGFLKETHPGKSPNEMSDRSMLGNLSLTQGCCSLNEAPVQFDETILLTKEKFSHIEREEKSSIEQETEALTGESISPTIPSLSAKNISAVVKSGDLAADMDVIEIPGNFAAEMSSNNGRLSHGVGENLDENLPCTVHTSETLSQDHDGMESLKPATSSTISSDDLLSESVVPQRADIAEDSGELFSQDMGDTQGDSFLKEVPTWSLKDPITLFTEEDTETCSGTMLPATNFELFIETSPIVLHPGELAAKVDNSTASSEDLFNDNVGGTKIVMPNLLPVELEQLSAAEQPQKCHEMDLAELSSGASANNAFPDGTDLQSAEPFCMVTGGNNFVADTGGFPRGPTTSNLPEEEHIEKNMKCDKLLDEYVIVEADDCNQGSCSIYSPNGSVFDIELQDDYLPGSADIDSHNLETDEMSYPKSTIVTPQIDNQTMSSTALCSEFPIAGSSYSSDAKLSDGVCQTMSSEPDVGNGSSLFLSESEDSFSRGSMDGSNHFLVEPAIPLVDDNEGNVTSLNQEDKHLEASDIQFDRAFSDEQTISQGNPKDIDNQTLKLDPYAILTTVEMNEFDTRYELREVEAVPSESTSKVSAGSMTSDIFPIIATSSSGISETRAPECLERQPVEAIFSLQSQDVEGTSPLPPLPPVPEFLESNVVEAASSLQLQDVEGLPPLPPLPPVPEFLEPKVVEAASSLHVQDVEETLPLPPLPPVEWRMGNLRYGCLRSVGDTAQPPKAANTFMALSPLDAKHPQVSVTAGFEMVQPTTSPLWKDERVPQGSLNSEGESRHAELPPIADKDGLNHGMNPPNLFLPVSHSENERYSGAHDAGMLVVEEKITQHQEQLQGAQSIEDKRPRLGQLVPSLELERSKHESTGIGAPVVPLNPFLPVSSSEEFKHQYGYGVYGGESLQHLNLSPPLPVTGPNMLPYGFLYKMRENPSMIFDFMVPSTEVERPSCKHRSIRDRPRNPLIEAVAAHDKSKLRKVSELDPPQNRPKADERDSLLEQIRNKSFNLKPVNAPKVNIKGPPTNLKLAAILEKANAIRQAFVGSDEDDDDDGESWNGS